ncbi:MAG TPA: hypothetical protein VEG38_06335 [Acidimicrobiia bacterium]|nr:hypothetical protein [Acidimicrobiia bacterium]
MTERQHLDDQKGPKTHATPAGVDRKDMSEAGPGMARASTGVAGANHDPAIEGDDAATNLGDPAEAGPADRAAVPGAES